MRSYTQLIRLSGGIIFTALLLMVSCCQEQKTELITQAYFLPAHYEATLLKHADPERWKKIGAPVTIPRDPFEDVIDPDDPFGNAPKPKDWEQDIHQWALPKLGIPLDTDRGYKAEIKLFDWRSIIELRHTPTAHLRLMEILPGIEQVRDGKSQIVSGPKLAQSSEDDVLELMDLAALAKENPKAEVYRVRVSRSFDPPLVFELDVSGGRSGILYTKKVRQETRGMYLVSTGLIKNSQIKISRLQAYSFLGLIKDADFWNLPEKDWKETTIIGSEPIADSMKDGSTWIIEGISKGKYHRLERRSPTSDAYWPDEILEKRGARRTALEGNLIAACIWLWTMGDEADQKIY